MSDLEPFADQFDDFERQLLRSTRKDVPTAGAASKTLVALGLAPTTAVVATAGAGAAAAAGRSLTVWSILKGLGVGALTGGALMVAADLAQRPEKQPLAPLSAPSHSMTAPTPRATRAAQPAPSSAADPQVDSGASASNLSNEVPSQQRRSDSLGVARASEPSRPALAPLSSVAAFAPQPSSEPAAAAPNAISIAEQVEIIDRARRALKDGRAREALADASAYSQRWPSGSLAIEAVIVRVEAELALGDRASAERDAQRVIDARPGSRYAARLRQLFSPPLAE